MVAGATGRRVVRGVALPLLEPEAGCLISCVRASNGARVLQAIAI